MWAMASSELTIFAMMDGMEQGSHRCSGETTTASCCISVVQSDVAGDDLEEIQKLLAIELA
jgi:hypothetical protein